MLYISSSEPHGTSYAVRDFDLKNAEDVKHFGAVFDRLWSKPSTSGAEYSEMFTADEMLAKKGFRGPPTEAQSFFAGLIRDAAESVGIWKDPPFLNNMTEEQRSRFFDFVMRSAPQLKSRRREVWTRLGQGLQNRRKYVLDKRLGKRIVKGSKAMD